MVNIPHMDEMGLGFWLGRSRCFLGVSGVLFLEMNRFDSPLKDSLWPVIWCCFLKKSTWTKTNGIYI